MTTKQRRFRTPESMLKSAKKHLADTEALTKSRHDAFKDAFAKLDYWRGVVAALEGQQPELPLDKGADTTATPSVSGPDSQEADKGQDTTVTVTLSVPVVGLTGQGSVMIAPPDTETVATSAGAPLQPPAEPQRDVPHATGNEVTLTADVTPVAQRRAYRQSNIPCAKSEGECAHEHTFIEDGVRKCSTLQRSWA